MAISSNLFYSVSIIFISIISTLLMFYYEDLEMYMVCTMHSIYIYTLFLSTNIYVYLYWYIHIYVHYIYIG